MASSFCKGVNGIVMNRYYCLHKPYIPRKKQKRLLRHQYISKIVENELRSLITDMISGLEWKNKKLSAENKELKKYKEEKEFEEEEWESKMFSKNQ